MDPKILALFAQMIASNHMPCVAIPPMQAPDGGVLKGMVCHWIEAAPASAPDDQDAPAQPAPKAKKHKAEPAPDDQSDGPVPVTPPSSPSHKGWTFN